MDFLAYLAPVAFVFAEEPHKSEVWRGIKPWSVKLNAL